MKLPAQSPETLLAAACVRWPRSPAKDEAVRAAAAGVDWTRFRGVVVRHRIAALVYDAVMRAGVAPPPQFLAALREAASAASHAGLRLAAETVRLNRLFEAAGVPVGFVKGAALGASAYGDVGIRHSKDVDLLVARPDMARAIALLTADGYAATYPPAVGPAQLQAMLPWTVQFAFRKAGVEVELHWRLFENPHYAPAINAARPERPVEIFPGATVLTLSPDEEFIYLCAHGAKHGWDRLKWLADIGALMAPDPAERVPRAWRLACEAGARRPVAQALLLCEALLGLPLPPDVAAQMKADPAVRAITVRALEFLAAEGGERQLLDQRMRSWRFTAAYLPRLAPGWPYLRAQLMDMAIPPELRVRLGLPVWLAPLYLLIRPVDWLWRRLRRT